jgi:hypothetical protein
MVALRSLFRLSPLLSLLSSSLPILALSTPTPVFSVPGASNTSWFENLAVRPNGLILATRGDAPEIWQIDPATGSGALLVSVAGAFNLTGIAEVVPRKNRPRSQPEETYVFGSSHIPAPLVVAPGSAKVWKLKFGAGGTPTVSLLAALPSAGFINGIAPWRRGRVLLSDTIAEAIYLMNAGTGSFTTPLTNLSGINGIKTAPGYVYFANHMAGSLSRVPVDKTAVPTGPVEVLAADQPIDDFAIDVKKNGKGKAYIGAMYDNAVVEVSFGQAPSSSPGVKRLVAENLTGTGFGLCTAVAFGRRAGDSGLLYASASMGGGSAAIVSVDP